MNIYFIEPNDTGGGGYISRGLYKRHIIKEGYKIVENIHRADLIHGYGPATLQLVSRLCKKYCIPSFVNLNGIKYSPSMSYYMFNKYMSPRYYRNLFILKKYMDGITHFFTLNKFFKSQWVHDGIPANKFTVIPNMVDIQFPVHDRSESESIRMLYIGEQSHYRLPGLARELYNNLKKRFNCTLTTIYNNIAYSDMPQIYREHDIYLQTMKFPICTTRTIIESMIYGICPVIYGNQYFSPIIMNMENGVLINNIDFYSWNDVLSMLCSDRKKIKRISDNAKKDIWKICHPNRIIKQYSDVYENFNC